MIYIENKVTELLDRVIEIPLGNVTRAIYEKKETVEIPFHPPSGRGDDWEDENSRTKKYQVLSYKAEGLLFEEWRDVSVGIRSTPGYILQIGNSGDIFDSKKDLPKGAEGTHIIGIIGDYFLELNSLYISFEEAIRNKRIKEWENEKKMMKQNKEKEANLKLEKQIDSAIKCIDKLR